MRTCHNRRVFAATGGGELYGAGIRNEGTLNLTWSSVEKNTLTATDGNETNIFGAGIYNDSSAVCNISHCNIDSNRALSSASVNNTHAYGVGISNSGKMTIDKSFINNNTSRVNHIQGAGLYSEYDLSVSNSKICNNETLTYLDQDATDALGTGVYVSLSKCYSNVVFTNTLIFSNYSGIINYSGDCYIKGVGLYAFAKSGTTKKLQLINCTVVGNIYPYNGSTSFHASGAGIFADCTVDIINTVLDSNYMRKDSSQTVDYIISNYAANNTNAVSYAYHSLIDKDSFKFFINYNKNASAFYQTYGNNSCNDQSSWYPFEDKNKNPVNLHLAYISYAYQTDPEAPLRPVNPSNPVSPVIDGAYKKSDNTIPALNNMPSVPQTDLDGMPRTIGAGADMGVYEYFDKVSSVTNFTADTGNGKDIKLRWTAPAAHADTSVDSYKVYVTPISASEQEENPYTIGKYETYCTIERLTTGVKYLITFQPVATNSTGTHYAYETVSVTAVVEGNSTVVTTDKDIVSSTDCLVSLREAVTMYADAGDTITFSEELDGKTITLDSEIVIDKNVSITGNSAAKTIISGNNKCGIFNIAAGITVNISSLTLSNAKSSSYGAVAVNSNARLNIGSCTFTNNTSTSWNSGGGAIRCYSGSVLSVTQSEFTKNSGSYGFGGAILLSWATADIINCSFSANIAGAGGAICHLSGTTTVSGCSFKNNSAYSYGGAINVNGGTMTVKSNNENVRTSVSGNTAGSDGGGGIYISAGTLKCNGVTITNNSTTGGAAGIYTAVNTVELSNTTVTDNFILNPDTTKKTNNIGLASGRSLIACDTLSSSNVGISVAKYPTAEEAVLVIKHSDNFTGDILTSKVFSDVSGYGFVTDARGDVYMYLSDGTLPSGLVIDAPTLKSKTTTTVTLTPLTGFEYSKDGNTWQPSNVFTGLTPATQYSFYQRIAKTAITQASSASSALKVTTGALTIPAAPSAPTLKSKTTTTVTLTAHTGFEYSMDGVKWQTSNVFTGLTPATQYSFCQRIAKTSTAQASSASSALKVTTGALPIPAAPSAPTLKSKTTTTVTLTAHTGFEYSMDGVKWQTSNVFAGLKPDTTYSFRQRIAKTASAQASTASSALKVTTVKTTVPSVDEFSEISISDSDFAFMGADRIVRCVDGKTVKELLLLATPGTVMYAADGKTAAAADSMIVTGMILTLKNSSGTAVDSAYVVVLGDIDASGTISAADARIALRASVRLETLNKYQLAAADIDGAVKTAGTDISDISASDARLILRASVKLEYPLNWISAKKLNH